MRIIIDLVLLLIVALCIWNGYKSGLVGGFAGILAIIIALLAGSMLSSNYAYEAIPVLEPFVDGYIDSQKTRDEVLDEMGYGSRTCLWRMCWNRTALFAMTMRFSASGRSASPSSVPKNWRSGRYGIPIRPNRA